MAEADGWRPMRTAPRDGTRILVTTRPVEQGPAEVDMAYWAKADRYGMEGWRAADSHPGLIVAYAEPELKCWMPMPGAGAMAGAGAAAAPAARPAVMPKPYEGEEIETDGSGI
ncbi:MAG: hypothetical protein F9K19_01895 [Rhizobiaceae bacterium]|nr:MAG: hypothetical protein F9K19_01895 [Rhizobiaceae bacterium]CAG0998532.1 hypothetical protein RHIZO_02672 [Rhizobiaceae bacterium]